MGRGTGISAAGNLQSIEEAEDIAHHLLWGPGIGAYPVIGHFLVVRAPRLHEVAVVLKGIVGRKHRPIAIPGRSPCTFFGRDIQKDDGMALQQRTGGVVSLGGGAVLTDSTRELLERHTVIFLDISPEEGARRTSGDSNRPVLASDNPLEHYRNLVEVRRPYYQEVADYRVRTDARTPQQVVGDILGFLDTL